MDNITHSLVGLAAADAVVRFREWRGKPQPEPMRRWLWTAALIGANLADIDVLYSYITEGRLGYLLHHRGHTHTFVGLVPQMLAIWLALRFWAKRSGRALSRADWAWALVLGLFGELSHIGLDALNVYGVHPLWPFDNRWFYGDSVFIVEPWLWVTLIPALYFSATTKLARMLLTMSLGVVLTLSFFSGLVPWFCSLPLLGIAFLMWRGTRKFTPGTRTAMAILAGLLPVVLFIYTSTYLKRTLASQYGSGPIVLHDVALSPAPANPFCWSVLTLETYDGGKAYRIRQGKIAALPSVVGVKHCRAFDTDERTAQWLPTEASQQDSLVWSGEIRNTVENLRKLAEHCQVAAFLRFARIPFFQEAGKDLLMGDLRFDRQRGLGFAEIQTLREPFKCPAFVPDWEEPLSHLLR